MRKFNWVFFLLFISKIYQAQISHQWSNSFGGVNSEYGQAIASDPSGNVYVTGIFTGVVDFDPGPGTATISSVSGSQDIYLAKYNSAGVFLWAKQIAGTNTERPFDLVADASGAYLAGIFMGTVDFDPSLSTSNITSLGGGTDGDGFFAKYDINGNLSWVNRIGSTANDRVIGIAVDGSQNVYVTGFIGGNADMDPSASVVTLSANATYNTFFGKYTSSGAYTFAKQITGGYSEGDDINVDASGNIYLTGSYATSNDFDPSIATANLSTSSLTQLDIFLAKYSSSGTYIYAKQIGGLGVDIGFQVVPDALGNVYLGGVFSSSCDFDPSIATSTLTSAGQGDLFVAKYNNFGNLIWKNGTGGTTNDYCYGLGLDASNNVFITGKFQGVNIDFDPGPAVSALTASSSCIYLAAYNSSGNFLFVNSPGNILSEGRGLTVNSSVYLTGMFRNTADFDFSPSTVNLTSNGSDDAFIAKYNVCAGSPPLQPSVIAGNYTVCNGSTQTYSVVNDPLASSYNWTFPSGWAGSSTSNLCVVTTSNSGIISVAASNSCGVSASQTLAVNNLGFTNAIVTTTNTLCNGDLNGKAIVSFTGGTLPVNYLWSNSQSTPSVSTLGAGSHSLIITDANNCTIIKQFTITQPPTLNVTTIPSVTSVCVGGTISLSASSSGGTGLVSYSWMPNSLAGSSIVVAPTINTNYTATAIDQNNCISVSVNSIAVNSLPTISLSANPTSLCSGGVSTLTATSPGATSYSWSTNTNSSSVAVNNPGTYTATVTNISGCINTASINIGTSPSVTLAASSNVPVFCFGNTATISVTGALTYTWSNTSNSNSIVVSPTTSTTYSVIGSNSNCLGSASVSITVNPNPVISIVSNQSLICAGQSATLTASGAITYTWNPSIISNSLVITPNTTSSFTVSGSDINGCFNNTIYTQSVSLCLSNNEIIQNNNLDNLYIFPNPFSSNITIVNPLDFAEMRIVIFNSIGELLDDKILSNNKTEINLNHLPNGFYFIKVKLKNEEKIIKALKY